MIDDVYYIAKNKKDFDLLVEETGEDQPLWSQGDCLGESSPYDHDVDFIKKNEGIALFVDETGSQTITWCNAKDVGSFPESKRITRKEWLKIVTR